MSVMVITPVSSTAGVGYGTGCDELAPPLTSNQKAKHPVVPPTARYSASRGADQVGVRSCRIADGRPPSWGLPALSGLSFPRRGLHLDQVVGIAGAAEDLRRSWLLQVSRR